MPQQLALTYSHYKVTNMLSRSTTVGTFRFLYVCGVTRGYIHLDCALLLTNHMLNYITIHISGGHCDSDHD